MEGGKFLENIREYIAYGWHPFPVFTFWEQTMGKREKVPVYGWKQFQDRPPTESEIAEWMKNKLLPFFGIGVALYGAVVLDFDRKGESPDLSRWQESLFDGIPMWTKTASGGFHFFFQNPTGIRNSVNVFGGNKERGDTLLDIRGEGGLVVVGPTCLFSSDPRKAQTPKELAAITPLNAYDTRNIKSPADLPVVPAEFSVVLANKQPKYHAIEQPQVREGERNEAATSIAYKAVLNVRTRKEFFNAQESYWRIIKNKFENWERDQDEYKSCFASAAKKMRDANGEGWPFEDAQDMIRRVKQEVRDDEDYNEDMGKWNLQVEEVLRIGDLFKFTMKNGACFIMDALSLYSQLKFRSCYTAGTNLLLPKISNKNFDKYLQEQKITKIEETGATLTDILKELLSTQYLRLPYSESEEEARETVASSFWSKCGRKVMFSLQGISTTQSWLMHRASVSSILVALKDIKAYQITYKGLQFWIYEIGDDLGGEDTA